MVYKAAKSRTGFYKYRHSAKHEQFNINILEEVKLVMHMKMLMGEMNYIMEEYKD